MVWGGGETTKGEIDAKRHSRDDSVLFSMEHAQSATFENEMLSTFVSLIP